MNEEENEKYDFDDRDIGGQLKAAADRARKRREEGVKIIDFPYFLKTGEKRYIDNDKEGNTTL